MLGALALRYRARLLLLVAAFGLGAPLVVAADADGTLVIGAIGDSLSTGFDAHRLGDNRDLSWTTGTGVESYSKHLERALGKSSRSVNMAITGSKSADLGRQVARLLRHRPDFVTITIGANDLCAWPSEHAAKLARFEEVVADNIAAIVAQRPDVKIVIAAIPDMLNLWRVGSRQASCHERWKTFAICQPLLGANLTDSDRQAFAARWNDANDALARVAARFPANVRHDPAARHAVFTWKEISHIDCFHPSIAGQNMIADLAWQMIADDF